MSEEKKEEGFNTIQSAMRKAILEVTQEFLVENKSEIIKRAEKKLRRQEKSDNQTSFPGLD